MKIVIIDTEAATCNYLADNKTKFKIDIQNFTPVNRGAKLPAIAKKAKAEDPEAIFINLEGTYENRGRSNLKGIELLFWLRLKYNFTAPIITYGFLASAQVLRKKPEYAVLHAPGNYHVRLPDGFKSFFDSYGTDLTNGKLGVKVDNLNPEGIKNELKKLYDKFVRKAIDLDTERHRAANWWGVNVLWDCHEIMDKDESTLKYIPDVQVERGDFKKPLPTNIQNELTSLNGFLIKYNYGTLKSRVSDMTPTEETQLIVNVNIDDFPQLSRFPKILLIDDQAQEGWSDIYQHIIYGGINSNFHTLDFDSKEDIQEIKRKVSGHLKSNKVDCILLDLRLQPEKDKNRSLKEISGIKVLRSITHNFKGIPILVTSASNKIWSYQEVIKAGADAYWLKEGVDNLQKAKDSIKSYVNFIEIIAAFMNEEYQFLREMNENLKKFREPPAPRFWWVRRTWPTVRFDGRDVNTRLDSYTTAENVEKFYQDGILLFQNFLKGKYLQKSPQDRDWFYYSSIIIHLAKLIEKFHGRIIYERDRTKPTYGQLIETRGDTLGEELYKIRNRAAHAIGSRLIEFRDTQNSRSGEIYPNFKTFIKKMNEYLFEYTPPS